MLKGEPTKNLGTTFKKIVRRAGVEAGPKPFQNLRVSRQTELEQKRPTYVVCNWMGNTPKVAHKYYLTVTEQHFKEAVQNGGLAGNKRGTQPPATQCKQVNTETRSPYEVRDNASFSEVVGVFENALVAEEGLELPISFQGKTYLLAKAGDSLGTIPEKHSDYHHGT